MTSGPHNPEVIELFALAVALEPDERARLLDSRCRARPDLRLEIESLITADARSGAFLRSPLEQLRRARDRSDDPQPLPETAGDQIGPFALVSRVGEGGCGVVFLAERRTPVHQRVALKIIKPAAARSRAVIDAFQAERQTLALMDHPNIARFYDAGVSPAGRPYFVMEFVEGDRITEHCRRQSLALEARLRLFLDVCAAVQHAHTRAVIHRDIKPSNVLVAVNSGVPAPKVIDFGIAKALRSADDERAPALAIGTPAYMSPEQAASAADVDTRADVYALAALLFELLTDQPPYDHADLARLERADLADFLARTQPRTCRQAAPDRRIPADIELVCRKSLARDPRDRHPSADALAEDVRAFLARRPVSARTRTPLYVAARFLQRRLPLVLAVGAITLTAAVAAAGLWRAELMKQQKLGEARRASALASLLFTSSFKLSPADARPQSTSTIGLVRQFAAGLDKGVLADQPRVEYPLRAWVGRNLAAFRTEPAEARRHLERAETLRAQLEPELADDSSDLKPLAEGWADLGDFTRAEKLWSEHLAALRARHSETTVAAAETLINLASLRRRARDFAQAESLARRARDIFERLDRADGVGESLRSLAITVSEFPDRASEAILLAAEAVEHTRRAPDDVASNVTFALHTLAIVAKRAGDLERSERAFRETVDSPGFAALGPHRWTAQTLRDYANLLWECARLAEAEALARRAVEFDRAIAPDSAGLPDSLNRLATILRDSGRLDEAESVFREQHDLLLKSAGSPLSLAAAKSGLADTLCRAGRSCDEAARLAREAIDLRTRTPERTSYPIRSSRAVLAAALALCAKPRDAEAALDAAVEALHEDRQITPARRRILYERAALTYDQIDRHDKADACRAHAQRADPPPDPSTIPGPPPR